MDLPRVIAFDGDDTLWHNETLFSMSQGRFLALLSRHFDVPHRMPRPLNRLDCAISISFGCQT